MTNIEREVGKLEARMETVEQELAAIREDVRQIRDTIVGLRGGWMLLTVLVTMATTVGAAIAIYLPLMMGAN